MTLYLLFFSSLIHVSITFRPAPTRHPPQYSLSAPIVCVLVVGLYIYVHYIYIYIFIF